MVSDVCGSSLLVGLPDDIFTTVSRSLKPRDVCNLCLCCRSLYALAASEKVWFSQCDALGVIPPQDLIHWRNGVSSYKALCQFLVGVEPLFGIWVHQNPELGNVVYVMPGFISVVACRIIPQELGPLGLQHGPILWAPVFEILCDFDGSAAFFLHGRDKDNDYFYPGTLKAVDKSCNVLLLEVEPNGGQSDKELSRRIYRSDSLSKSQRVVGQSTSSTVSFSRLTFGDRRKLLEIVTSQVRFKVPDSANDLLFPPLKDCCDEKFRRMDERRSLLMRMYKLGGGGCNDFKGGAPPDPTQLELSYIRKSLDRSSGFHSSLSGDDGRTQCTKRKTLAGYFRQMLGKSTSTNGSHSHSHSHSHEILKSTSSSRENNKHAQLHEFLRSGDTIGLTLLASTMRLSSYRAWPNMHENRFALYKLPRRDATTGQEYAGLWGGTFGWPPGKPAEDKPGKALFFLFLSYEESQGQQLLIATKILEGTHYVLHPNGSAMFIVNIEKPSLDPFPWETDGDFTPVDVKHAFLGEGIANGYGFRYPGSKPGSLYVIQDELLAFIWKESRVVLTLQRINLQELLIKGERVNALPPVANFAYLTKSYSNVFAAFSNTVSSPRYQSII